MRAHPPFAAVSDLPPGLDSCILQGAARLAARIKDAWAACGHPVTVTVESLGSGMGWGIRMPDLVNGLPRNRSTRSAGD
jgi:hypothetical protein